MSARRAREQVHSHRDRMIAQLATLVASQPRRPLRVAVDGPDLAGKTTLADELARTLVATSPNIIRASADDFHHPREVRYRQGRTSPDGYYEDAFDLERLTKGLLEPLGPTGGRRYVTAVFDWRRDEPVPPSYRLAPNDAILIVDGVFLLRPELRSHWDFSIFVWASEQERLSRSLVRDAHAGTSTADVERLFWKRYAPAHRAYARQVDPHHLTDVFVDNERPTDVRVRVPSDGQATPTDAPMGER